mmetsp:Transcript_48873/g.126531  ORF Transcript_48873/g.126531 Transcript_48873/m.126531 type:complete len:171 (-) Transcript_48873:50-562(-)
MYYIEKQINPALERIFNLMGADIKSWFGSLPKNTRIPFFRRGKDKDSEEGKNTIPKFYLSQHCAICDALSTSVSLLCPTCSSSFQNVALVASLVQRREQERRQYLAAICRSCEGTGTGRLLSDYQPLSNNSERLGTACGSACESVACPITYTRWRQEGTAAAASALPSKE